MIRSEVNRRRGCLLPRPHDLIIIDGCASLEVGSLCTHDATSHKAIRHIYLEVNKPHVDLLPVDSQALHISLRIIILRSTKAVWALLPRPAINKIIDGWRLINHGCCGPSCETATSLPIY